MNSSSKLAYADGVQQKQGVPEVKTALWPGQLDTVITACVAWVDATRLDDPAQKAGTYYTNNRLRMDYPTYRAPGYQIGSGTIESGVKQIASQRLKVTGARWNLDNARQVALRPVPFFFQGNATRLRLLNQASLNFTDNLFIYLFNKGAYQYFGREV